MFFFGIFHYKNKYEDNLMKNDFNKNTRKIDF